MNILQPLKFVVGIAIANVIPFQLLSSDLISKLIAAIAAFMSTLT